MKRSDYVVDAQQVRKQLRRLAREDQGELAADRHVRNHYLEGQPLLWIDRHGVDSRADSLVAYLDRVEEGGISPDVFRRRQIQIDLQRVRQLEVGDSVKNLNAVLARLEYNLTKAFLRYCAGQRYGYLNAEYVMNHCDVKDSDSLHVTYYQLFDVKVKRPRRHSSAVPSIRSVMTVWPPSSTRCSPRTNCTRPCAGDSRKRS